MTDPFPRWPPDWVEDHDLAAEQTVAATDDVTLTTALRNDDRVLLSVSWPGGRRYLLVDPVGNETPQALRVGERAEDTDLARAIDALWSQALRVAKQLIDGELDAVAATTPAPAEPPARRRRWRRS